MEPLGGRLMRFYMSDTLPGINSTGHIFSWQVNNRLTVECLHLSVNAAHLENLP